MYFRAKGFFKRRGEASLGGSSVRFLLVPVLCFRFKGTKRKVDLVGATQLMEAQLCEVKHKRSLHQRFVENRPQKLKVSCPEIGI